MKVTTQRRRSGDTGTISLTQDELELTDRPLTKTPAVRTEAVEGLTTYSLET